MPPQQNFTQPPKPAPKPQSSLPQAEQSDLAKSEGFKNEANDLVKAKKFDEACVKYFAAINVIRLNEKLKKVPEGKTLEMACRANIAHCKLQVKEYDHVID
jgi:hypothetical protein